MEKTTVWQEERAPGRQHQQQQGRHVHTVPCLALGMGKELPLPQPQACLCVPRSGRRKSREHWSKQTQLSQHTCGH